MKKLKFFLCILIAVPVFAQNTTNLFQIITSDLPVERNPLFRDLQTTLENVKESDSVKVDLAILHTLANGYKEEILKFVKPLIIKADSNGYTITYRDKALLEVTVNKSQSVDDLLLSFDSQLNSKMKELLDDASNRILPSNPGMRNIIFFVCYSYLAKNDIKQFNYKETGNYRDSTIAQISKELDAVIKNVFVIGLKGISFNKPIEVIADPLIEKMNSEFVSISNIVNDKIVSLFNSIQTIITEQVEKPLSQKLRGLTGLSVSEGSGTFSGGIIYAFKKNNWKVSLYTNGNFSSQQDSAFHSFAGTRIGYVAERMQFDILFSIFFGDKEFKAFRVWELGGSINLNLGGETVLGAAYFYSQNKTPGKDWIIYSAGLMLKISQAAPAVVLGASFLRGSGKATPIFQISYPINAN